jgi:hypothetical protein
MDCFGPPVGRDHKLSNAKAFDDDLAESGIPATKWPLAAQAARPAGHDLLDAVVVGAPVDDALLDSLRFEVLGQGFADQGWEFGVGGEAESDELFDGELVDVGAVFGGEESSEAETLFEADDAVLHFGGTAASDAGHDEKDDGHGDPPKMSVCEPRPCVHGGIDGEDEVEQKHRQHDEMKERVEALVVFDVLWSGH